MSVLMTFSAWQLALEQGRVVNRQRQMNQQIPDYLVNVIADSKLTLTFSWLLSSVFILTDFV